MAQVFVTLGLAKVGVPTQYGASFLALKASSYYALTIPALGLAQVWVSAQYGARIPALGLDGAE